MARPGFPVRLVSGVPVVRTPLVINSSNAKALRAALRSAIAHGCATVVIDLSGTDLCDLVAFRELEQGHKRACAAGGELRLVIPGGRRVFEITGTDQAIRLYPALGAALADVPAIAIAPLPAHRRQRRLALGELAGSGL